MQKINLALVGFHKNLISNLKVDNYNIFDANVIFDNILKYDKAHIDLQSISENFDFGDLQIEDYWRLKGEYDHYSSRRIIPLSYEEQDLLFRSILHRTVALCRISDRIILSNLPHQGVDSVINRYAQIKAIPTYYFTPSIFKNYSYLIKEERNFSNLANNELKETQTRALPFDTTPKQNLYYMEKRYFSKELRVSNKIKTLRTLYKVNKYFPFRIIFQKIKNYMLHASYRAISWTNETTFDNEKLNIYFPLHLQPELSTSNMGGIFYDQNYALNKIISHCEKSGMHYCIYLKENPKQTLKDRMFLSRFVANKNVKFMNRNFPSNDLIQTCDLVCTISGTAGWEAVKSGKPCFLFGNTWFETAPGIIKNLNNIDAKLKNRKVDTFAVKQWFEEHQKSLFIFQNDDTVDDMMTLVSQSQKTLETVIREII